MGRAFCFKSEKTVSVNFLDDMCNEPQILTFSARHVFWPRWNECHFRIKDKSMLPQNKTSASIYRINTQCLKMVFSIRWMLFVTPPRKLEAEWTTKISCGKLFEALDSKTKQHSIALGEKFRRWLLIMEGKLFRMNFNHGLKYQGYITWQQLGVSQIITPS